MSNRLKYEKSPYLLQHADNPVDWYPWCQEAFEKAEREDKPVFLSIGYSTCHWCHVMERESFENEEIARILNKYFVSVKVDREERPDIDSVYMSVCQTMTGSGGWPMSIFMTPLQKPFFAGTYFPPVTIRGMTGLKDLLLAIADRWQQDKDALVQSAEKILAHLIDVTEEELCEGIDTSLPERAAELLSGSYDEANGGFGDAPKFPMPYNLIFLTLYAKLYPQGISQNMRLRRGQTSSGNMYKEEKIFKMVRVTLDKMRRGGLFDQIGYGFSRYSTDAYFLVPHFEKMLYDNALLIAAYAIAYKEAGDGEFLDTAERTALYMLREMSGPAGEFYSAQDADSEGEEGKFYVWGYDEIINVIGRERGERFCKYFGVTKKGNFEGKNILNLLSGEDICDNFSEEKRLLYDYRKSRARLHLDDKVLTSWNSLAICGLCILYQVSGKKEYLQAAKRTQEYIEGNLTDGNILYVSCRGGRGQVKGFLDEYACYTAALISLYDSGFQEMYLERAKEICNEAARQFADDRNGGYFLYGLENGRLITRPKEVYDNSLPSGNSVMAYCLVRLAEITGKEEYEEAAKRQLAFMSGAAEHYPAGCCMFLIAELLYMHPPKKVCDGEKCINIGSV